MADNFADRLEREFTEGRVDMDRPPELPAVPQPTNDVDSLLRTVKALKTLVENLAGRSGTNFDKALTLRDLVDAGIAGLRVGGQVLSGPPTGGVVQPIDPNNPGYIDPRPVLSVPPTPTSVTAAGAFRNVIVAWKLFNYKNHAYCEVWRAGTDNLSLATRIGTTTANVYIDGNVTSGVTYYYWVRAVNTEGNLGAYQSTAGISATLALLEDEDVPPQFIKHAMIGLLAVDDGNIANLNAGKINAGYLSADRIEANSLHGDKITVNTLQGDRILANTITGNKLVANTVTADKINGLDLKVMSGDFTGPGFPLGDLAGGFYLGPEGLFMGNLTNNRYFQALSSGNVYGPGFALENGNARFSGQLVAASGSFSGTLTADAISAVTTINIAGDAVSTHSADMQEVVDNATSWTFTTSVYMGYSGQLTVMAFVWVYGSFPDGSLTTATPSVTSDATTTYITSGTLSIRNDISTIPVMFVVDNTTTGWVNCTVTVTVSGVNPPSTGSRGARLSFMRLRKYR